MEITCKEDHQEKINIIMRQTDYSEDIARVKMVEYNNDHIQVIKSFLEITEKKTPPKVTSVNQEIYKQIRTKLDKSMKVFNDKQSEKLQSEIKDLKLN